MSKEKLIYVETEPQKNKCDSTKLRQINYEYIPELNIENLFKQVSETFKVSQISLYSKSRKREYQLPKSVIAYCIYNSGYTLKETGKMLNNLHHTSVVHKLHQINFIVNRNFWIYPEEKTAIEFINNYFSNKKFSLLSENKKAKITTISKITFGFMKNSIRKYVNKIK